MEVRVDEDETITSDFSVSELWQRLPLLLVEETLGFLTLQNGKRLCRVSTEWKALLSRHALFNKGIIFFQWTRKRPKHHRWSVGDEARLLWAEQLCSLYLKSNTMNHFVLVEKLDIEQSSMDFGPLCHTLTGIHQPVKSITFYKHRITGSAWCLKSLREMLLKKPMTVRFVDCVLDVTMAWFGYFSESNGWSCASDYFYYFSWDFSLPRGNRVLDMEAFQSIEAAIAADEKDPDHEQNFDLKAFNNWLLSGTAIKLISVLWPYPGEQFQWLKICLGSLEAIVNVDVARLMATTYDGYCEWRETAFGSKIDESMTKMGLRWNDHELDIVDCAFLARLLNLTPGVPKPPYELPKDVTSV